MKHSLTLFRLAATCCFVLLLPTGLAQAKSKNKSSNDNALLSLPELNGVYFALRHGESVPSSEKRVCATMESGTDPKNGLTEKGREEVLLSSTEWIKTNKKMVQEYLEQDRLVVVTSPFSRTKESAQIFVETLQKKLKGSVPEKYKKSGLQPIIVVENDLREREFGEFEGQLNSGKIYDQVWAEDRKNPRHVKWGVESTAAVQKRSSQVIVKLDQDSQASGGKLFVLVAHGDTLKILQTAFQKQSPAEHANKESVVPIKTAEIRQFQLASEPAQAKN
jgi:Fructose-2,6-bisphosphatase